MDANLVPAAGVQTVTIGREGRVLRLREAGMHRQIDAQKLRRACRCAACTAARLTGADIVSAPEIRITAATPIGAYAVNLTFSDGHARGVFPFSYLVSLNAESAA